MPDSYAVQYVQSRLNTLNVIDADRELQAAKFPRICSVRCDWKEAR